MKVVTANKINRLWRNGVLAKMIAKTKVLNTAEEIEANTSAENVAGAVVAKELYNNLTAQTGQVFRYGIDSNGNRGIIVTGEDGADTVIPFRRDKLTSVHVVASYNTHYGGDMSWTRLSEADPKYCLLVINQYANEAAINNPAYYATSTGKLISEQYNKSLGYGTNYYQSFLYELEVENSVILKAGYPALFYGIFFEV